MLERCQSRVRSHGLEDRVELHLGPADSLPAGKRYDAATSILVSHFVTELGARCRFFEAIAEHLRPGAPLVTADLCADSNTPEFDREMTRWRQMIRYAGADEEAER